MSAIPVEPVAAAEIPGPDDVVPWTPVPCEEEPNTPKLKWLVLASLPYTPAFACEADVLAYDVDLSTPLPFDEVPSAPGPVDE